MSSGFFDVRNWFRQEILYSLQPLSIPNKKLIYNDVVKACGLEKFLQIKYATQQRFGLDGGEATIPALNAILMEAASSGMDSAIIGMAHRGRLNTLANVCHMSIHSILNEFEGNVPEHLRDLNGDVKYHIGINHGLKLPDGQHINIEMIPNPSHLEAVNPLVLGKVRARQAMRNDVECTSVLPLLIHGDASFTGQGSCYETMGFCELENFHCGGTVHVVINNQIGFTTSPDQGRATRYCTDLAKVNNAPVMHVNGHNVEACVKAARIAARFRQQFHRDIILDIVCYRRNGHNEQDLPDFTQPQMYDYIRKLPPLVDIYSKQLIEEGVILADERATKEKEWEGIMRHAFDRLSSVHDFVKVEPVFDPESENTSAELAARKLEKRKLDERKPKPIETAVNAQVLRRVGTHITSIPKEMQEAHPVVQRTYAARQKGIENGDAVEWCLAELLAFGTLSLQGVHIRLTGEDVERGTFTQRHAGITDQKTNLKYFPVQTLSPSQALITISNSSLSELGCCGFETGYNMEVPKSLCMWEAQFGDFANGAQVIFDQFLCSCEQKWNLHSSLVISLPHGYSGAGPEHSSARIERFLQLSDDVDQVPADFRSSTPQELLEERIYQHNWQVMYPSTPANYFHLLRRQGLRDYARPLINFFSKARLRAPNLSTVDEMAAGTEFRPVIDTGKPGVVARKLVFCTGQIESIVNDARVAMQKKEPGVHNDVVLATVEQLSPFPWEQVADVIDKYTALNKDVKIAWMQEEPKNMGMWRYMRIRFNSLLRHLNLPQRNIDYIGRPAVASPATGYGSVHVAEEKKLIEETLA
ncbi:2-oxoglutarate dehydrogenase E1 component [Strigomonas culicis]|uniref:2-oxoglutarate dehydrogenase E1 component n=1 Tax=Strigomonas culicis TaxID=28005 RepID=S9VVF8_9TRYP|nr:2-oxoglutarate dehydrogenase E1 component [Strigomonas culicis]|eukprot:EPY27310.1 2-oxoglutarate dehydrogenase E1 component [Strigomonas culicis]